MALFTSDELQIAQDVIEAAIRENFPNISIRRGTVMKELVAKASALGYAVVSRALEDFKATNSLSAVASSTVPVDDSVIDALLSNWFITRKQGASATGLIKVTMATNRNLFLAAGAEFISSNNLVFTTETAFLIEEVPTTSTSIQLHLDVASGLYYFLISVTAADEGDEYSIPQGTQLENTTIGADLVLAEAFTDFAGGVDTESSTDLLARAQEVITVRDLVTTKAIKAVLPEEFAAMQDIAVVGYGDPEMSRDQGAGLGFGAGGRVDIYVRNFQDPVVKTLVKTLSGSSTFELSVTPDEVPFYRIESIIPVDLPGIELADDVDIVFSLQTGTPNDLLGQARHARFSKYEKATVTVNSPGYEGMDLYVSVSYPPQVLDVQTFVLGENDRVVAADLLVKGIIPVFVTMELEIVRPLFGNPVDLEAIKTALRDHVNTLPAGTPLSLSKLVQIVQGFSINWLNLSNLKVTGELHKLDGTVEELEAVDVLEVALDRKIGVSQRNVAYLVTQNDIQIFELLE